MNIAACQQLMEGVGSGVASSLRAIDCAAAATAQSAFGRLFGPEGGLLFALQMLLTLYVAFFAFSLLTGRTRLGVSALTPRMIMLGVTLTFATSWAAYHTYVWNLAVGAPNQIASLLMGTPGLATDIFAQKIDVVFAALVETANAQGAQEATSAFSPPGLMWLGGTLLLLGTVGVLATSKIALAVLLALGPLFVVLALFSSTRGLFVGWLKGVVLLALAPLFAVLGGSLMLELAVPVLRALGQIPGQIDARAAMAFFMIGAVHIALMVMVLRIAGTMVAGWTVFGLAASAPAEADRSTPSAPVRARAAATLPPRASAIAAAGGVQQSAPSRAIRLAAVPAAANDASPLAGSVRRETLVSAALTPAPGASAGPSRTRGIGNRFRPAPALSRETYR